MSKTLELTELEICAIRNALLTEFEKWNRIVNSNTSTTFLKDIAIQGKQEVVSLIKKFDNL